MGPYGALFRGQRGTKEARTVLALFAFLGVVTLLVVGVALMLYNDHVQHKQMRGLGDRRP